MNKTDNDTRLLEQLLDRYRFARPVPDDVREEILSSKKKNLVRVLRTVGAFSALYGVYITAYFFLKKLVAGISFINILVSAVTVTAVTYGGYYAITQRSAGDVRKASPVKKEERRQPEETQKWVDRITLYNGRIIEGAIISRGDQYRVRTASGIVQIPRSKIKMVQPLKTGPEPGAVVPVTQ
ncbi:MAG TPA: hypothetical protein PLM53_11210 [Spirochaetota bacterium]|nr:hypothetical protein [Spirochaetota bacterium]HPC41517.1 hypothetical protein [Spirochaetota bacterium]HPL15596.1 hypothetical protein [Spirochaetota bacterium]HQF09115.1 hypothetical protein [Spirochaetota bacterium]HQH97660.1 hypothetical protein [Spirochaetota bacterium]